MQQRKNLNNGYMTTGMIIAVTLIGQLQKKEELKAGIFKTVYQLHIIGENSFQDITKTEYEAFKALELESDLLTQKMELTHKIEAATATDEEIREDEEKEFEFFRKYAN